MPSNGGCPEQDALSLIGDQHQQAGLVTPHEGARRVAEREGGHGHIVTLRAGSDGREAHRGHRRLGVDPARDRPVISARVLSQEVRGNRPRVVVGGVRVQREAGDVARAPEIGLSRHAAAFVHGQVAARVGLDAHVLEPDAVQVGSLACRDDHPLDRRGPPVIEREPRPTRGGLHARDVHAQPHVDAVLAQRRRERRRHRRLFAGQELRRVLDQRHATAEADEHLGDLAPHRPAADDDGGGR